MIKLWEDETPGWISDLPGTVPSITPFLLLNGKPNAAVIVCPGGGYHMKAPHEGEPVARWLNSIGISAFVLDYRVYPYRHPYPWMDVQRAVRLVRVRAAEWGLRPDRIGVLGFSAGGHLASTIATHFDNGNGEAEDPVERVSSRPDAAILCYPVISFKDFPHLGSRDALLGEDAGNDVIDFLSNELQVTAKTCPVFLWHTADDETVPVENSLLFASALSRSKVPFECHVFPKGRHGVGLAVDQPELGVWTSLCANWLKGLGFTE